MFARANSGRTGAGSTPKRTSSAAKRRPNTGTPTASASGTGTPLSSSTPVSSAKPQGRGELLDWVNLVSGASYSAVPDLKDGILYCQLLYSLTMQAAAFFMNEAEGDDEGGAAATRTLKETLAMKKLREQQSQEWEEKQTKARGLLARLRWMPRSEDDCYFNMELLRDFLRSCVPKQRTLEIDTIRLAEGKLQDNMNFLKWLHGYHSRIQERCPTNKLTNLLAQREQVQRDSPNIVLKQELVWTRGPREAHEAIYGDSAATSQGEAAAKYNPVRYQEPAPAGPSSSSSSSSRGRTRNRRGEGGGGSSGAAEQPPQTPLDYLKPIVDHVERCEQQMEKKVIEQNQNNEIVFAHLDRLAVVRDDLREALTDVARLAFSFDDKDEGEGEGDGGALMMTPDERQFWEDLRSVYTSHSGIFPTPPSGTVDDE